MLGSPEFSQISSNAWAADMDADDVCIHVVSPTPVFFSYDRDPAEAAVISRA